MDMSRLGAIPSPIDIRDYKLSAVSGAVKLPESFDTGIVKIKDQGNKQTCVAYSLSEIIEYHHKKETNKYQQFSTEFIYGLRKEDGYKGEGMYLRDGLETIREYGDVTISQLSGNNDVKEAMKRVSNNIDKLKELAYPNRITSYYRIETIQDLKYALYHHGPVSASMWWYDGCDLDRKYTYVYDKNRGRGGHAVMIAGWNKNRILVQNSWGLLWGKSGRFYVKEDDFFDLFFDVFGITDDISAVKKPNIVVNKISKVVNKVANAVLYKNH